MKNEPLKGCIQDIERMIGEGLTYREIKKLLDDSLRKSLREIAAKMIREGYTAKEIAAYHYKFMVWISTEMGKCLRILLNP